ncbi:MAG: DUF3467 domain-containing protein [Desulfarculus sp.]|nr:DUF3467 domain-containing protein [Pseudomonadota bacterium]MBV1717232.1 DUF3467 domain-containing protein [Desulfarculus sp.]MBU4576535.1 DUF3467 domain-containing protein [Pseudomonadota bacterium]MBU4598458.1 DUF3467 domain-containing protein [Pseudomonadota bacterium]MBV1737040.1 DUF3467 domain-containing protein [Desulfarculus sp.]
MAAEESGKEQVQIGPIPQFYIPMFTVAHSSLDFKIVGFFANCLSDTKPGPNGMSVGVRAGIEIVVSPGGAKELLNTLKTNIEKFEKEFGEINPPRKGKQPPAE